MTASTRLLSHAVPGVVLDDSDAAGAFVATHLGYRAEDPCSVTIELGEDLSWEFARTSLLDGLWSQSGEGQVQVYPDQEAVLLDLATPVGSILLDLDRDAVESFLAESFALVPLGSEGDYLDVDACIEQLLSAE